MTCDEFRRRWLADRADADQAASTPPDQWPAIGLGLVAARSIAGAWRQHVASCPACAAWERGQRTLDDALARALFVVAPPELAASLARIPAPIPTVANARTDLRPDDRTIGRDAGGSQPAATARGWLQGGRLLIELALLIIGGLGLVGLGGVVMGGVIGPLVVEALLVIATLLGSPLLAELQSIVAVGVQSLATLLLLALIISQVPPNPVPRQP